MGSNGLMDVKAGELGASAKGVNVVYGTFRCRRGYDLHTTTYVPSVRLTTACLVFHHGLSDHAERHGQVLAHLCASLGMPVYTFDAHGHGRSGPDGPVCRALVRTHQHLVDDLLDFTRLYVTKAEQQQQQQQAERAAAASRPAQSDNASSACGAQQNGRQHHQQQPGRRPRIFLLGYSMGGLVTSLAVAETCSDPAPSTSSPAPPQTASSSWGQQSSVDPPAAAAAAADVAAAAGPSGASGSSLYEGLMLTSGLTDPLYGNHPVLRLIKVAYVTALSWLAPALPMFKRNPVESGIRDPAAAAAMADDMMWYRGKFKVATVASLLAGCARLRSLARRMSAVPLYVQHATVDVSCSLASMRAHLAAVRPADLTMHVVEGAFHDLHHDPETPMLLGRMVEWLRKRV